MHCKQHLLNIYWNFILKSIKFKETEIYYIRWQKGRGIYNVSLSELIHGDAIDESLGLL